MIAQKVSFAFFNNLTTSVLGYVSLFFIARLMGPNALGIVAFALAYVGIFSSFSDLGFGTAHIKRVSEGKDFGRCNGTYLSVTFLLTTAMAIIVFLTILVPKIFQHKHFVSEEHEIAVYIILVATVFGNISMFFNITFGARKETAKQSVPLLVGKFVEVIGKVVVAVVGLGAVFLAGANLLSSVVVFLFFIMLFRNYPIKRPDITYLKSYIKFAFPVMFIGMLSAIAQNMDKVMIQFFSSTEQVGYYSAGQSIALVVLFITVASNTLIFPTISSYHSRGDVESIRLLSNEAERYLSMILLPMVVFIIVFSKPICSILLGSRFAESASILTILSLVALVDGVSQPYTQQIGATDHIMIAARISSAIFLLDIILNFVFIPKAIFGIKFLGLGMYGAALSTLISMSIGAIVFRFYAYRITGSRPNPRIVSNLLAALVMGFVLYFVSNYVYRNSFYLLVLCGLAGITVYVLCLFLLRSFGRKELELFLRIANPVALKNYATNEIKSGFVDTK
jgi:O-antigen/teichoic acid export membrane protein